jgi:hypothetical protein
MFSSLAVLASTIALSGCAPSVTLPASQRGSLDPIAFFTGSTHGDGELNKLFNSRTKVIVDSIGRRQGDTLIVDQTIREGDKPSRVRRWTIWPVAPNRYSGTLTEATGPVRIRVTGPRASIHYTMNHGLRVEQQLALQSDGKTILNRLDVLKFGARLATLSETIRKVD